MLVKYKKNKKAHLYDDENPPIHIPPPERPRGAFESCGDCNFAGHGFFCYSKEGDCLMTNIRKSNERR